MSAPSHDNPAPARANPVRWFGHRQLLRLLGKSERTMAWQVHDARDGLIARGESEVAAMHDRQPWAFGQPG